MNPTPVKQNGKEVTNVQTYALFGGVGVSDCALP